MTFLIARKPLLRWLGWFFVGNVFLFLVCGLSYFFSALRFFSSANSISEHIITYAFFFLAYVSQLTLLAFLPALLPLLLILIIPNKKIILTSSIIVATLATLILLIDTTIFSQYHFHLNSLLFTMATSKEANQIFDFSWLEWEIFTLLILGILIFEITLGRYIWKKISATPKFKINTKRYVISLIISLFLSYYTLLISTISPTINLVKQANTIPLYFDFFSKLLPWQKNLVLLANITNSDTPQLILPNQPLNYPLHPLVCKPPQKPMNIVFIVVDTWRFDMLTPNVMPNLYKFAANSWQFKNHSSGGNGTQPGIFSLFYGLPSSYWPATIEQHQGPIFIRELLQQNYQVNAYAGAELVLPPFHKNVFVDLKHPQLFTPGKDPYVRDIYIANEFNQLVTRTKQPFFTFLFYDAAHSYCADGNPIQLFQPSAKYCQRIFLNNKSDPTPFINRYKNSLYFVDQLVGQNIEALRTHHLLDNTIMVITGDHGNEFNDNRLNYWGHASNFTKYQIQTPLLIYWPGKKPTIFNYQTSHYDIVPTLLTHALGCQNPPKDYSIGKQILEDVSTSYLLVYGYTNFGIIEPNRITVSLPTGNYQVDNLQGAPLSNSEVHMPVLLDALTDMKRYYQKP